VRRARWLASLLWTSAACGRIGFGALGATPGDAANPVDTAAVALVVPPTLSFDAVCGQAMAATADLTITNPGTAAATITDAVASTGFTVVTGLPLDIPAGGSATLTVRPPAAVVGTDIPGSAKTGTLTVTADGASYGVALSATTVGSTVELQTLAGGTFVLALSGFSGQCPAPVSALLVNTGNTSANIVFETPTAFVLAGFSGGALDAGASALVQIRADTEAACSGSGSIGYNVPASSCDVEPTTIDGTFVITGASMCFCS